MYILVFKYFFFHSSDDFVFHPFLAIMIFGKLTIYCSLICRIFLTQKAIPSIISRKIAYNDVNLIQAYFIYNKYK